MTLHTERSFGGAKGPVGEPASWQTNPMLGAALALLLLLGASSRVSLPDPNRKQAVRDSEFVEAKSESKRIGQNTEIGSASCAIAGGRVSTRGVGRLTWSGAGGVVYDVAIPLPEAGVEPGVVERLWCGQVDGDLLVVHQSAYLGAEGDYVAGGAFRVSAASGRVAWSVRLQGNTGKPLRSGSSLYVTGIGFVGKVDVESGAFCWKHEGLYRSPGLYNSFDVPRIVGDAVVFPAVNVNGVNGVGVSGALVVDSVTGRIREGATVP